MLADEGTFEEWDKVMPISNPLSYKGYEEKVKKLQEKTNLDEAIVTGKAKIGGISVVLGVCDSRFSWPVWEKMWVKKLPEQWNGQRRNGFL